MNGLGGAPQVIVVRHGATEWSVLDKHTGRTDVPLTDGGREQARAVAPRLAALRPAAVWTSPLQRAAETCRLAGFEPDEVVDDLMEWDYGDAEGRTTVQLREEVPDWAVWTHGAPGGESVADLDARADRLCARLRAVDGQVLVFAHGHLLRALAARWIGLPVTEGRRLLLDTGHLGELGAHRGLPALVRWNA